MALALRTQFSAAAEFYRRNPFFAYDPLRSLEAFHQSRHNRRLVRKPNQIGGSYAGAWEAWAHLIGKHRWKPDLEPSPGLILVASLQNTYAEISKKLWLTAPLDSLDPATKYIEGKGWLTNGKRMIRSKAGHTIEFRSGEGSAMSVESITVGWLWIDEPPKPGHFAGALSRVAVAGGPVWMTFTPVNRPVAWLRLHVEGDAERGIAPREEWEQHRPKLTEADCTTLSGRAIRSAASILVQIAGYTRSQIAQRVYGEWEGISEERRLSAFNEAEHEARLQPEGFDTAIDTSHGVGIDHGEHVGNQVAIHARYQVQGRRRIAWVTGECVSTTITTEADDARAIIGMLRAGGIELRHVDRLVGDINSAGKSRAGRKINEVLTDELNAQAGHRGQLVTVEAAQKGRILDRVRTINLALMHGELFIHPSCKGLLEAIRMWDGSPQTESYKHYIDALCYLLCPILDRTGKDGPGRLRLSA